MSNKRLQNNNRERYLENEMQRYLSENGITIDINGLEDTVKNYFRHEDMMIDNIHELLIELNLWTNYFYGLIGLLQLKQEEYILEMDVLLSKKDKDIDDQLLLSDISQLKNRIKQIKLFLKSLNKYTKFLTIAFWECRKTLRRSLKTLLYKSNY